jgi:hypothetical protein
MFSLAFAQIANVFSALNFLWTWIAAKGYTARETDPFSKPRLIRSTPHGSEKIHPTS